jgi:outer membrane receptor for ferrienterochelin and colicins
MKRKSSAYIIASFLLAGSIACAQDIADMPIDSLLSVKHAAVSTYLDFIRVNTASKHIELLADAPASVSVITAGDIESFGYRTLDEVMASIRGFYTSYDRNYSYLGVRGFGRPSDYNNRILLLLNGHTMNENFFGSAAAGSDFALNLAGVERIEIVRGPGSTLYGSGAMFAVINIVTKEPDDGGVLRADAELSSFGGKNVRMLAGGSPLDDMKFLVAGTFTDRSGPDLYFSEFDTDSTNHGLAKGLDWAKSMGVFSQAQWNALSLQGGWYKYRKGIPTASYGTNFGDPREETSDERAFVEAKYDDNLFRNTTLMIRGFFDYYKYTGVYPYDMVQDESSTGKWLGGEFQLRWDALEGNQLVMGLEYNRHLTANYELFNDGQELYKSNTPYTVLSMYIEDRYRMLDCLSLSLGVRHDRFSTMGNHSSPRATAVWNYGEHGSLKLLAGEAMRVPNMYEGKFEDPYSGTKANPALEPERILTLEVVGEQRIMRSLYGSLSVFRYDIKNLIDQIIDPTDSLSQYVNRARIRTTGLEAELSYRKIDGSRVYLNYGYQDARDIESGATVTNSPEHILKAGFSWPVLKSISAGSEIQCQSNRLTERGGKTDPFFLMNVIFSFRPALLLPGTAATALDHCKLTFAIKNLWNAEYAFPGGVELEQDAIIQDGRVYSFTFSLNF